MYYCSRMKTVFNKVTILVFCLLLLSVVVKAKDKVVFDDYCVVLVTSAQCGYSLVNTVWFNTLADRYSGQIQMVALSESKRKVIERLPELYPGREVVLRGWTLVPDARDVYMPLVERETFPQIILLKNGKVVERFVGTIQPVKDAVEKALPEFVGEKQAAAKGQGI